MIEKSLKCLLILICRRFRGGPVEGFMGGASLETFSGEAQLKNHPVQGSDPKRDEHALWIAAEKEEGVPDIILTQSDGEEVAAPAG